MKKTFIYLAMAAFAVVGFTACGSDDEDYVAPKYDVQLPLPQNAKDAVAFDNIKNMTSKGKTLAGITFTETGNAILEVAGDYISAAYTYADGIYTLTGAANGTIKDNATKGTSTQSTNITISITVTIDGITYTFNGDAAADKETATEMVSNTDLNNICRLWTVKGMSLSLSGEVSMMKVYDSGDLSKLGKDANENGANLDADELAELNKIIQSIEFTKSGKFFLNYKEGGENVTQCATWESKDFHSYVIDKISEANKFITNGSSIQVVFNAVGGCTITFSTKITGSKNYDAQLIINLI